MSSERSGGGGKFAAMMRARLAAVTGEASMGCKEHSWLCNQLSFVLARLTANYLQASASSAPATQTAERNDTPVQEAVLEGGASHR